MSMRLILVGLVCLPGMLSCKAAGAMAGDATGQGKAEGSGGAEMSAQCKGDFGVSASARKLEAFLSASSDFMLTAGELEGSLLAACKDIGQKLEVPEAEMQASGDTPAVKAACGAASAKLKAELGELRASAKLDIDIVAEPPRCEVSMDAMAQCAAECDATVEPGSIDVKCEGGEIVGKCGGSCKGSCSVEAEGTCGGSCEGTCEGGCGGTCEGACEGKCSAKNAQGECAGKCDGTCHGTCSAKCKGECKGECWVKAEAECKGECKGECSVAFEAPRCTGDVTPPKVEADCQASCDAKLDAKAECKPGRASVVIKGKATADAEARLAKVRAAIEGSWGAVMAARAKLEKLGASGQAMVETGAKIPGAIGELGLSAAGCATQAAAGIVKASASVSVSVEASASVSGAATSG
jgi:hypothetical protein